MYICKKTTMTTITRTIKIEHEKFGVLLNETFMDGIQFKIFLKMVHGCIELKNDLSFFNGVDFLVFIPTKILQECIVVTFSGTEYGLAEHMKSKIEALVTR
jgi:hypothetical protein